MLEFMPSRKSAFVRPPWARVDEGDEAPTLVAQRKSSSRRKAGRCGRPHSYHGKAAAAAPLPKVCSATAGAAISCGGASRGVPGAAPFARRKDAKWAQDGVDGGACAKGAGGNGNCAADDTKSVARHLTDRLLASLNCAYSNAFPSQLKRSLSGSGASNGDDAAGTPPTSPLIEFGAGGGFGDVSRTWRFHPFRMR